MLSAQTGKCFLQSTSESVQPVAFPDGKEDPLRGRRLHLAPQISGDNPLKFPSGLVVDFSSVELRVRAIEKVRQGVQVPLENQTPTIAQLVKLGLVEWLHL